MAGMAANVSLFRKNIDGADGSIVKFDRHTQDVGRNIDKLSGRLGLLVDVAATLGPALIPTAAAAVPLLAGLSNQLGFVAIAGGSTILAFNGVGDALKAVNEQAINPSAANLEKMHQAMATLGPAGRDFVRELQSMRPEMQKLQDAAQAGLFPGMTDGIQALTTRLPQAQGIISQVTETLGRLMADAGESLAGPQWDDFFSMLETQARPTLMALGESIGQVTKGLADLWVAFTPLNSSFSQGMLEASRSFAEWADGLEQTQGFQEFVAYLEETGPQVADTLGAMGSAILDLLEAAAPLGGPALMAIKAFSEAISAVANSDLGTPLLGAVAAFRAYSLAIGLAEKAQLRFNAVQAGGFAGAAGKSKAGGGLFSGYTSSLLGVVSAQERAQTAASKTSATISAQRAAFAQGAAGAALLGLSMTGVADKAGASNTALLGLTGLMLGGGIGAAFGLTAGAAIDLAHANDDLNDSLAQLAAIAGKVDFSTFNRQLDDAQKKVNDLAHVTGVGDALSDTLKSIGGAIKDPLSTHRGRIEDKQSQISAAEQRQQTAGRNAGSAAASQQYAISASLAAAGFKVTAAGAREAAMSVQQFTASMKGASAALDRLNNWDSFRGAVLDAKDAVASAGKTLKANGDIIKGQGRDMQRAGLESRGQLRNIASQAIKTSESMKDVGKRTKFLDGARAQFIAVARAMGASAPAARAMANNFGLVDRGASKSAGSVSDLGGKIRSLKSKIVQAKANGAKESSSEVQALRNQIAALRDKQVTIRVRRYSYNSGIGSAGAITPADGTTVPGARYPYEDKIPAILAPGEEVISNRYGQADRHRNLLKQINANMLADGGTADRRRGNGGGGGGGKNDDDSHHHVNKFTKALKEATKELNKEKAARAALISKRSDLAGSVRDQFLTDPFGDTGNVWAKGAGDPRAKLRADIAKAKAFQGVLGKLKAQGLDGDALAAIASTGDVGKAQALASLGKAGVGQYESLYKQRASAAAMVGKYAGAAAYNPQISETNKEIRKLSAEVRHLRREAGHHAKTSGRETGKEINKTAGRVRRGKRG